MKTKYQNNVGFLSNKSSVPKIINFLSSNRSTLSLKIIIPKKKTVTSITNLICIQDNGRIPKRNGVRRSRTNTIAQS